MNKSLSQMAEALANSTTVTLSDGTGTYGLGGLSAQHTYANTAITNNSAVTGTTYNGPYTVTGSNTAPYTLGTGTGITQPWFSNSLTPKIKLDGEGADIEVNGESLMGLMKEIRERLNLITINEKMEKEWDQLRELGNQYRALEAKLKEQGEMWAKLKATTPPDVK